MVNRCLIILLAICASSFYTKAQQGIQQKLDSLLLTAIEESPATGISVGLIVNKQITVSSIGHYSDVSEQPVTTESIFEIGSITKVFTGTLLAELVLEEVVELSDPIGKFLPDTLELEERVYNITLGELTTHTSGLPRLPGNLFHPNFSMENPYRDYSVTNLYTFLETFVGPLEKKYSYSNLGVGLLGHIISRIRGKSYGTLLKERLFQPLEMSASSLEVENDSVLVKGYSGNGTIAGSWDFDVMAPAGEIKSTVSDMLKFLNANMNPEQDSLLYSAFNLSHRKVSTINNLQSIGYNWHLHNILGSNWIVHDGQTGGYNAYLAISKDKLIGIVLLTNASYTHQKLFLELLYLASN